MNLNYKVCSNRFKKLRQNSLKEHITIKNEQYEKFIIHRRLNEFKKSCNSLYIMSQNGNILYLINNINSLLKFKEDVSNGVFSSAFLQNQISNFLISLLDDEIDEIYLKKKLTETVLDAINNFIYYSIEIAEDFAEQNLISELFGHWGMFTNQDKSDAILIISNLISVKEITNYDLDFEKLFQICEYELYESDDCLVEKAVIHLFVILSSRNDIFCDIGIMQTLFNFFYQMFNNENTHLFGESLLGIYYLAQTKMGCEMIVSDEECRAETAVRCGLNMPSEQIVYHSLLVAQILYLHLEDERLDFFHQKIPLKSFNKFLGDHDDDIQKATLNTIRLIVDNHPQFIPSLLSSGIYDDYGLLWIFKCSPFELKKSASYIVMGTVENGDEQTVDYLIEKELVIYATEIITSDSHFFNDDNRSLLIIDTLLHLLSSFIFKDKLITQLIDSGVYEMILSFETTNEDIDQKFNILRNLIEEKIDE